MKIAAIIGMDKETVKPLVGGPVIRIRDTESGEEQEVSNPAVSATKARRIAALQELLHHNVDVVINPPETFCAHSYKAAQQHHLRFWNVPAETAWDDLWKDDEAIRLQNYSTEISEERLASHHNHNH